uniref:Acetylglutamate kinase n=1 Tax=Bostrychia simpliciuscula TaxID=324754 RepID=A0A1Z1M7U0_9FLOR|nr:acetylglutamate kinase [Bostrychia simpliciuscula]ARW62157.1 acetylglutamate kinase [Bostrychia simpliciuscula]
MSNLLNLDRFSFLKDILPFLQRYFGSTFVIKYGGSVIQNDLLKSDVIKDICLLHCLGINIVLVHGGGFLINHWLHKLKIQPKFVDGVRVTDSDTMQVVEMVLTGKINNELVSLLNQNNVFSVGLCGKDGNLIKASSLSNMPNNLTGKVDYVDNKIINLLLSNKCIPVVASVASDFNGKTYNINADAVASSIASSLKADKLILLTDTPGILSDLHNSSTLIRYLNLDKIKHLQLNNIISGGMIPKVNSCVSALNSHVRSAHIIDGRVKHSLLYEVFTKQRIGSMIVF